MTGGRNGIYAQYGGYGAGYPADNRVFNSLHNRTSNTAASPAMGQRHGYSGEILPRGLGGYRNPFNHFMSRSDTAGNLVYRQRLGAATYGTEASMSRPGFGQVTGQISNFGPGHNLEELVGLSFILGLGYSLGQTAGRSSMYRTRYTSDSGYRSGRGYTSFPALPESSSVSTTMTSATAPPSANTYGSYTPCPRCNHQGPYGPIQFP